MANRYFGALSGAVLLAATAGLIQLAAAQQTIAERVTEACQTEIDNYCSQVTTGEGRLLACFYAHEDKLSSECVVALYEGMAQLERIIEAISYVASQCRTDIETLCADTVPGEGRIAECLLADRAALSAPCDSAIDEVGLTLAE